MTNQMGFGEERSVQYKLSTASREQAAQLVRRERLAVGAGARGRSCLDSAPCGSSPTPAVDTGDGISSWSAAGSVNDIR